MALAQLKNLTRLSLHGNELTGVDPGRVSPTQKPDRICGFTDNELTGSIPVELGQLKNLTRLNLGDNELTGAIPAELGQLKNLTNLWLRGNKLTGSIPTELAQLKNLRLTV